jgi:hypothetical protein
VAAQVSAGTGAGDGPTPQSHTPDLYIIVRSLLSYSTSCLILTFTLVFSQPPSLHNPLPPEVPEQRRREDLKHHHVSRCTTSRPPPLSPPFNVFSLAFLTLSLLCMFSWFDCNTICFFSFWGFRTQIVASHFRYQAFTASVSFLVLLPQCCQRKNQALALKPPRRTSLRLRCHRAVHTQNAIAKRMYISLRSASLSATMSPPITAFGRMQTLKLLPYSFPILLNLCVFLSASPATLV